jgi:hypothetical protein
MTENLYAHLIGKPVIIRSRGSGVWAATLDAHDGNQTARLTRARRVWSWVGAGECSALALFGPVSGLIGPACSVVVSEVVEVHPMRGKAIDAFGSIPEWTGCAANTLDAGQNRGMGEAAGHGNGFGGGSGAGDVDPQAHGDGRGDGRGGGLGCGMRVAEQEGK